MKSIIAFALLVILILAASNQIACAGGYWTVQGSSAAETLTFPNSKGPISLLIIFNSKNNCKPEVALLLWQDKSMKLGDFAKQQLTKDIMTVTIDGQNFPGFTTYTKYSNAIETSTAATEPFLSKMGIGRTANVKGTNKSPTIEFPLEGAASAIDTARRNCR